MIQKKNDPDTITSVRERIVHELDRLSEAKLVQLARYVAFLEYQARVEAAPAIDEPQLAAVYAESSEEDRELAEEDLAEYGRALEREDAP